MIWLLFPRDGKRRFAWKRLLAVIVIALIALLLYTLNPGWGTNTSGPIGIKSPGEADKGDKPGRRLLDTNLVEIRNEVFVLNREEIARDKLREVLAQLKREKPEAILELRLTGDEKQGMVTELERAAEQLSLRLQK